VLHLKFDGDYKDASGRGNHGTPQGSPQIVGGPIGTGAVHYNTDKDAAVFNYVALGTPADLSFDANTSFSVAYWVRFTGIPGDLPFFCSSANSYGSPGLTFAPSYNQGGWSYWVGGETGSVGLYGPRNSLNDGNWHSLVHVFDRSANAVTFLDGVQVDVRSLVGVGAVNSGNQFCVGQDPSGAYPESGSADLDDLGVWRRALTDFEAQSIYIVGKGYGRSFDTVGPQSVTLGYSHTGNTLGLTWSTGVLQSADAVTGPWTAVSGANPPSYSTATTSADRKYYRVKVSD